MKNIQYNSKKKNAKEQTMLQKTKDCTT